jgi:hypothetical protein
MSALTKTLLHRALQVHDAVYRNAHGWVGHRTLGVPSLPGKPRTTSLSYARDGDNYLIVASQGGARRAPAGTTM